VTPTAARPGGVEVGADAGGMTARCPDEGRMKGRVKGRMKAA